MNSIVLAIPPLEEQHRIVAKVDELMALCDELEQQETNHLKSHQLLVETLLGTLTQAKDSSEFQTAWATLAHHFDDLFITEDSIDQLKQTILQLAVMGKLVPQDPKDEPAGELLERIAKMDRKAWAKKDLREINKEEIPFQIPIGWIWVKLGDVLNKITDGTHHSPPNGENGDYLYISAKNIKQEGVQLSNATYVTKEVHEEIYSRCDPEKGDVLYIKDGATTGIATINDVEKPFSMLSSVALLKVSQAILNTYLLLSVRSPFFYGEMRKEMTGVAITRVTLKKLNEAIISLPPLFEQQRIVGKVDDLFTLCDSLKERITEAQKVANLMAGSILEQV